jgi:MbtH protein
MSNDDTTIYRAVFNHEEQWSVWPIDRPLPRGWTDSGTSGSKQDCLKQIEAVWTDMRPRSLREAMASEARSESD